MNWVDAIQAKLPFLGPPEQRSEAQIDHDLEDEFAFHIEMRTRDLINEGHAPEAARGIAIAQFGNSQSIKQQCKRIALKEHIMLQRVNFVMMIVVLVLVVIVGVQVFVTQRYNTLALQDITTQLAKMRVDAASEARDRGWGTAQQPPAETGRVLVQGDVTEPGWHQIDLTNGTTLLQLLQRLRVRPDQWVVLSGGDAARRQPVLVRDYLDGDSGPILRPSDEVYVTDEVSIGNARQYYRPRIWKVSQTWTARDTQAGTFMLHHDISLPRGGATTLVHEESGEYWNVLLNNSGITVGQRANFLADWDFQDDHLVLDFTTARDARTLLPVEPGIFGGLILHFNPSSEVEKFHRLNHAARIYAAVSRDLIYYLDLFGETWQQGDVTVIAGKMLEQIQQSAVANLGQPIEPEFVEAIERTFGIGRSCLFDNEAWSGNLQPTERSVIWRRCLTRMLKHVDPVPGSSTAQVLDRALERYPNRRSENIANIIRGVNLAKAEVDDRDR